MTESKLENGYSFCFNSWALDTQIKNELGLLLIISSLTAKTGVCFASNQYFSELFSETDISISRKIKKLEKLGYIEIEYEKRGCQVIHRKIRLTKMLIDDKQNCQSTINKNVKDNNISYNITRDNNKKKIQKEKIKLEEVVDFETLFTYWEENKNGSKYKTPDSRERMLNRLKTLTNGDFSFAKKVILFCIDSGYQGFCNGSELYYRSDNGKKRYESNFTDPKSGMPF